MMRKSVLAAIAMFASATMASADEHVIIYLGQAFFPSVTHVKAGDTVRFVNSSESDTQIMGENADWLVGPLTVNQEGVLEIETSMSKTFFATEPTGEDEDEVDADDTNDDVNRTTVEGALSFAPLG